MTTADRPSTDEPSTDEPSTDEPSTDEPSTDEPSTAGAWGGDTRREVWLNLGANRAPAMAITAITALTLLGVGAAVQWWTVVDRALQVTLGSRARLDPVAQAPQRLPLVVTTGLAAVVLVGLVTWLATARRRAAERHVFELLGGPADYTTRPALVEGLIEGGTGGVVAALGSLLTGPIVAAYERSSLPGSFTLTTQQVGHKTATATYGFRPSQITVSVTTTVVVAVVLALAGAVLGVGAAALSTAKRPSPQDETD